MTVDMRFENIVLAGQHAQSKGELHVSEKELKWKAQYVSKQVRLPVRDILEVHWTDMGPSFQLKLLMKEGSPVKLQGFKNVDFQTLNEFADTHLGFAIEQIDLATSGWNWGALKYKSASTGFMVDDKLAFEVPYTDISQASIQGRHDISLEFHEDDAVPEGNDELVELRFHVPDSFVLDENLVDEEGEEEQFGSATEAFHKYFLQKTGLADTKEEAIASFDNILFLTPRGRFDIEVYRGYIQLHGKSFSYKILYKNVSRLFLLPRPDGHTTFVMDLDPGIRQGATWYPYLQMAFKDEDEIELAPNVTDDEIKTAYKDKMTPMMNGAYHAVMAKVLHAVTRRPVHQPKDFSSSVDEFCVRCSYKTNDGYLFPLSTSLFFVHKPPTHLRHDDIASVEFMRVGGGTSSRTFDLIVNQATDKQHHMFVGINRDEYKSLFDYFTSKDILILNAEAGAGDAAEMTTTRSGRSVKAVVDVAALAEEPIKEAATVDEDEEEEDEEFEAIESSSSDSEDYSSGSDAAVSGGSVKEEEEASEPGSESE